MNRSSKFVAGFGIVFIILIMTLATVSVFLDKVADAKRQIWFEKHNCYREGYLANLHTTRIYKCDDGRTYIWKDIPLGQ